MTSYDAFISYGQDADGALAAALQVGLQRLAKPWTKRRAMEVFRDASGMSANPDLRGTLLGGLADSRFLVLLASPDSAASPWVNDELTTFTARDELAWQRVIIVLTDGEWKWAGDGNYTPESTAVPKALVGVFRTEPLYVDMRWAKGVADLTLANPRFKAAVADVAAPIRGIPEDELIGEDVRLFRLAKRLRWSAMIGLSVLLVASLIASAVAVSNGREAVRQKNAAQAQTALAVAAEAAAKEERDRAEAATIEAVNNAAIARSGELATAALAMRDDDPEVAAALAVEALYPNGETEMRRSPQADNAVGVTARGLLARVFAPVDHLPDATTGIPIASVDRYLAMLTIPTGFDACWPRYVEGVGEPTPITWWDRESGEQVDGAPEGVELPVSFISTASNVFRIDDARTVTPIAGVPLVEPMLLPVGDGAEPPPIAPCPAHGAPATYDAASGTVVSFDALAGEFVVADATTGQRRSTMSRAGVTDWGDVAVAGGVVFAAEFSGAVSIWALDGGGSTPADAPITSQWVEGAGGWIVSSGAAARIDSSTGFSGVAMQGGFEYAAEVAISPDGRFVAETDGMNVGVWQLDDVRPVASLPSSSVRSLFWAGDDLVIVSARGADVYAVRQPDSIDGPTQMMVSADGSVVVLAGSDLPSPIVSVDDAAHPFAPSIGQFDLADPFARLVQLSADGTMLLTRGSNAVLQRVPSGEVVFSRSNAIASLDPTGAWLAVLPYSAEPSVTLPLEIVDTADGSVTTTVAGLADGVIRDIVWLGTDRLLVVEFDGTARSARLAGTDWLLEDIAWPGGSGGLWVDPDRGLLWMADTTGRVQLWSYSTSDGEEPLRLGGMVAGTTTVTSVSFDSAHAQVVTVAGSEVTLWDVSDRNAPRRVETLDRLPALLTLNSFDASVSFGGDDRFIFVHSFDTVVVLPGFDPARLCAELSDDDLARASAIIGNESACTRIPELSAVG